LDATPDRLIFKRDGAQHFVGALDAPELSTLDALIGGGLTTQPGLRLHGVDGLEALIGGGSTPGRIANAMLDAPARAVRAVVFDKTADLNWPLGWHQDRTIVVRQRIETPGFGPWSIKQGLQHVEPPFAIIEGMATLRIHLDPVDADNAPLLVAPGSHLRGRVPVAEVAQVAATLGTVPCLAGAGDVWAYATPILHASEAAKRPRRRRVLQVDYACINLPAPLEWLGV